MKILEALIASGHLSFLDLCLAKELLQGSNSENAAALICHLSLSARRGHLCIEIAQGFISPDPLVTWNENRYAEEGAFDEAATQNFLQLIPKMIVDGAQELPSDLITDLSFDNHDLFAVQTPFCRMGHRLYFQRYWFYETSFLRYYQRFLTTAPQVSLDTKFLALKLQKMEEAKELLPEQKEAIFNSCNNALTIICGGPGTGKTYTAGKLICLLWESLTATQRDTFEIALAAPTGKAAANLQKSLTKAASGSDRLSSLQAKTLHALLGIKSSASISEITPLPFDLVIVDESSMIDVRMMATLFAAMKPGARLILLGDRHQLPAVEAGSLFADLVQSDQSGTDNFKVCQLEKCLRAELQGILDVAAAINRGDVTGTLELFGKSSSHAGVQRLIFDRGAIKETTLAKKICRYAFECYQVQKLSHLNPSEILDHFNRFRLLSPLRKGLFGVEEVNRMINQEHKNWMNEIQQQDTAYIAPIIVLKNEYRLELFNGEVGVLVRPTFKGALGDFEFAQGDYALFTGKDGEVKRVPALLLPSFEYAYCLSVHKSQGSEFEHLLLLLPPGSECFGRELLYTAVTRARRQLTLWAGDKTLSDTIARKTFRLSGIIARQALST